jgi:hypothetical protein
MTVVQCIRSHAQRYSERPFLSSMVFVRLTGANFFLPFARVANLAGPSSGVAQKKCVPFPAFRGLI